MSRAMDKFLETQRKLKEQLNSRIAELEADAVSAVDEHDRLQKKLQDWNIDCCCEYDRSGDICAIHHPRIKAAERRVGEMKAEVLLLKDRLLGAINLLPADITVRELRQYADEVSCLRERTEKAEAERDKIKAELITEIDCTETSELERDRARELLREFGNHAPGCNQQNMRPGQEPNHPCTCGWDEARGVDNRAALDGRQ